jgi:hypothetical protein
MKTCNIIDAGRTKKAASNQRNRSLLKILIVKE